jgi:hypothetical protein
VRGLVGLSLVLALAACSGGGTEQSRGPAAGSPTTTHPTQSATTTGITDAENYLEADVISGKWRSFDPISATGLFVDGPYAEGGFELRRLVVVGRAGRIATLTCARDLPCLNDHWWNYPATLGPGPDEVTVRSRDRKVHVIGYDATLRRTLDLSATTIADGRATHGLAISDLAWSPDGAVLAVATSEFQPPRSELWLVEGDGAPHLAYSSRTPFGDVSWSPDGQSLLFDQLLPALGRSSVPGAYVMVLHRSSAGSSPAVSRQVLYRSNRAWDWTESVAWSPDGTRIAVRTKNHVIEISARDGAVHARHPQVNGWLIWPEKED